MWNNFQIWTFIGAVLAKYPQPLIAFHNRRILLDDELNGVPVGFWVGTD
jgi:hypothetical protein